MCFSGLTKYTLYNIVIKVRHDPYVYEAYTLKANNIFIPDYAIGKFQSKQTYYKI